MEEIDTSGKPERKSSLKTSTGNNLPAASSASANVGMDSLKDGAYNEADSHNSFLEALNAWRNAGKPPEERSTPSTSKKVKFTDVQQAWAYQKDPSKKGSFFANLGESKDFSLGNIPTWQESGTQPLKSSTGKESCWQCFKLYSLDVETSKFKEGQRVSTSPYHHLSRLIIVL